jgi:two-component system sensor histidine kinase QseC
MVESLNRLFSRVQSALDNERQFTANAAHELRTPLAALKTITQAKQLSDTSEENQRFLRKILAGIDRTSHLLEQLLTLARMESQSMTMQHFEQVDLAKQVLEVISDIGQAAFDRNIDLSYDGDDDGVMVKGYGPALQIMIRNLIDNAIRYTPAHGSVRIATQEDPQVVKLLIEDSGPGIPSEQMSQIFQRFKRGENVDEQGSGPGLSIVQRIVKLHHGRIKMENIGADSGLRVTVQLSNADASKSYLENNA